MPSCPVLARIYFNVEKPGPLGQNFNVCEKNCVLVNS